MDVRYPIGWMFALMGAVLCVWGMARPGLRAPLAAVNVNLWAGLGMLIFGAAMILLARRARK